LKNDLASIKVAVFIGTYRVFTDIFHTIFINSARALGTDTKSGLTGKVDRLKVIFVAITKIKLKFEPSIWVILII
jgi:hypothetical protein